MRDSLNDLVCKRISIAKYIFARDGGFYEGGGLLMLVYGVQRVRAGIDM